MTLQRVYKSNTNHQFSIEVLSSLVYKGKDCIRDWTDDFRDDTFFKTLVLLILFTTSGYTVCVPHCFSNERYFFLTLFCILYFKIICISSAFFCGSFTRRYYICRPHATIIGQLLMRKLLSYFRFFRLRPTLYTRRKYLTRGEVF